MRIVTYNKNDRFQDLKDHLLYRKHSQKIIDYFFITLFQPRKHESNAKNIIFTTTYNNPNHQFSFNKFKNHIKNTTNRELQKAFNDKKNNPYYKTAKDIKKYARTSEIGAKSPKLTVMTVFTINLDTLSFARHFLLK